MTDLETALREGLDEVAGLVPLPPDGWAAYCARRPRRQVRRRLRLTASLAAVAAATAGIVIGAIALSSTSTGPNGSLGSTGRTVMLAPTRQVSPQQLQDAAGVLGKRLAADRVPAEVRLADGASRIAVTAPAGALGAVAALAGTHGVLRFRQALSITAGTPAGGSAGNGTTQLPFSPTLTAAFERSFASWDCASGRNPTHGNEPASDYMIACSTDGTQKYLLAPAAVEGSRITSAAAGLETVAGGHAWVVNIQFDHSGAQAWRQLTARADAVTHGAPQTTGCTPAKGCNSVAIVLDGVVQEAPYIDQPGGIAGGHSQVADGFNRQSATRFAAIITSGALPTTFRAVH